MDILKDIMSEVKSQLPQFNKVLITQTRQQMLKNLPNIIDQLMHYLIADRIPGLTYHGFREADPKTFAQHIDSSDYYHADIQDSHLKLVIYDFSLTTEYGEEKCPFYCYMPFLWEERFELNGTKYYPVFTICDKFITRIRNTSKDDLNRYEGLGFPCMIQYVIFRFRSRDRNLYKSEAGRGISATILKLNAHHNLKNDSVILPPALLYPLARFGLLETLLQYGLEPEQVSFVDSLPKIDDHIHDYFKVSDLIYLKINRDCLNNIKNRRFIVNLLNIVASASAPNLDYLYDPEATYFKFILGKWIQGEGAPPLQQKNQAIEHLRTMDILLDPISKAALKEEGVYANNFYEVIQFVFTHIDSLLHFYEQNDLFEKRIALLPQLMFAFTSKLNRAMFGLSKQAMGDKRIQPKDLKKVFKASERLLVKKLEQLPAIFMSPGDVSNDNWLLTIGGRKYRLKKLRNPFNTQGSGEGSIRTDATILAHPSQPFVESIFNLPASNPAIGGTINIFYSGVGVDGIFHQPPEYEYFKDMYKHVPNKEE